MGSEQSNLRQNSLHSDKQPNNVLRKQHTIANPESSNDVERPGSTSPGPSICSDSDLPYISYTVNRPIGDSPKLTNKQINKSKPVQRKLQQKNIKKSSTHSIVVVKPALVGPNVERDPDILKLQSIPMFLPIMRATLNLPAARDPEVLERLDPIPLTKLCLRYQDHLNSCATLVSTEQNQITQRIKETDAEIQGIMSVATDRQKKYSRYAERLMKIQELSHQLNRCHMILNQTLESIETLNDYLDIEDRLEPFVWTTG
nr:BLOC-1-related complex subunit 5 [Onthophagus taurus]